MGEYIWGAFTVLAIVAFSVAGAGAIVHYMESQRECNHNGDCRATAYCGSDFSCHEYPHVQTTNVQYDFTKAAAIVGLAIILGAVIVRAKNGR